LSTGITEWEASGGYIAAIKRIYENFKAIVKKGAPIKRTSVKRK